MSQEEIESKLKYLNEITDSIIIHTKAIQELTTHLSEAINIHSGQIEHYWEMLQKHAERIDLLNEQDGKIINIIEGHNNALAKILDVVGKVQGGEKLDINEFLSVQK